MITFQPTSDGSTRPPVFALNPAPAPRRRLWKTFRALFIGGPVLLVTSHLSARAALFMFAGVFPGLLCPMLLGIPGMLFRTPEQRAYYEFGQILQTDHASWLPLTLSLICTLASLGLPAGAARSVFHAVKG